MVGASGDAPCFEPGCACCTQWRVLDDVHLEQLVAERARVQYLVDWAGAKGLLEDGVFTFPDGESVEAAVSSPACDCQDSPDREAWMEGGHMGTCATVKAAPPTLAGPPHVDHPDDGYRYEGCSACAV